MPTKICPFCREEIRDEAIKCRYCGSSLLPPQPTPEDLGRKPTSGPDQVVYILDQGLIRFGKFAAAVLAIFVTVGLILYGVDVKQTAKDVEAAKETVATDRTEAEKTLAQAKDQFNQLQKQAQSVQEAQLKTSQMAAEAQAARDSVNASQQQAQASLHKAQQLVATISSEEAQARTGVEHIQILFSSAQTGSPAIGAASAGPGFSVPELAQLYDFPTEFDGRGQKIGLVELGGGYRKQDLDSYFKSLNIPTPTITDIAVDGAKNSPTGDAGGADGEVELDIEVAGAVAPGAEILVYFAPNTNQGFVDAIRKAVTDRLTVLVINWGEPESNYTSQTVEAINGSLQLAATRRITVLSGAGGTGGLGHTAFPTSSPWVLACGGTQITVAGNRILSEAAWNEGGGGVTGGGVSDLFPKPTWQMAVGVPADSTSRVGRRVPDVAIIASPESGYKVIIDGKWVVVGGTTASTTLWAGLIALINEGLRRNVGYINPDLYTKIGPAGVLRSTKADNTGSGWNAATGWGSPDGKKLLEAFRNLGSPQR